MSQTIAIAGAQGRIGTTTVAVKLTAFLARFGPACYVEANSTGYMKKAEGIYESAARDEKTGKLICENVDIWSLDDFWRSADSTNYEYVVFDCGAMDDNGFNENIFMSAEATVIVCGLKANELEYTERVLSGKHRDAIYAFNFVRNGDEADVAERMEDRKELTVFVPVMKDPFIDTETTAHQTFFYQLMDCVVAVAEAKHGNGR